MKKRRNFFNQKNLIAIAVKEVAASSDEVFIDTTSVVVTVRKVLVSSKKDFN